MVLENKDQIQEVFNKLKEFFYINNGYNAVDLTLLDISNGLLNYLPNNYDCYLYSIPEHIQEEAKNLTFEEALHLQTLSSWIQQKSGLFSPSGLSVYQMKIILNNMSVNNNAGYISSSLITAYFTSTNPNLEFDTLVGCDNYTNFSYGRTTDEGYDSTTNEYLYGYYWSAICQFSNPVGVYTYYVSLYDKAGDSHGTVSMDVYENGGVTNIINYTYIPILYRYKYLAPGYSDGSYGTTTIYGKITKGYQNNRVILATSVHNPNDISTTGVFPATIDELVNCSFKVVNEDGYVHYYGSGFSNKLYESNIDDNLQICWGTTESNFTTGSYQNLLIYTYINGVETEVQN